MLNIDLASLFINLATGSFELTATLAAAAAVCLSLTGTFATVQCSRFSSSDVHLVELLNYQIIVLLFFPKIF